VLSLARRLRCPSLLGIRAARAAALPALAKAGRRVRPYARPLTTPCVPPPRCSQYAYQLEGVRLDGRVNSYSCGTSNTAFDCYRECLCWNRAHECQYPEPEPPPPCDDDPLVACNYLSFTPGDASRCGGQNLCLMLGTITNVTVDAPSKVTTSYDFLPGPMVGEHPSHLREGERGGAARARAAAHAAWMKREGAGAMQCSCRLRRRRGGGVDGRVGVGGWCACERRGGRPVTPCHPRCRLATLHLQPAFTPRPAHAHALAFHAHC
jgi:hypothetical protein